MHRVCALLVLWCAIHGGLMGLELQRGSGSFVHEGGGKQMKVAYHIPKRAGRRSVVMVGIHALSRDADRMRDFLAPMCEKRGLILLVPEFDEKQFSGSTGFQYGNFVDRQWKVRPVEERGFTLVENMFQTVREELNLKADKYFLYGHSAGAQFVHRMMYFANPSVRMAIVANPGSWTMLDPEVDFPHGVKTFAPSDQQMASVLSRPMLILLGTEDTKKAYLDTSKQAMAQGPHRLARGKKAYEIAQALAEKLSVECSWQIAFVDGVGHEGGKMAEAAFEHLR